MEYLRERLAEIMGVQQDRQLAQPAIPKLPKILLISLPADASHGVAVTLESFADKKIAVIKAFMQMANLSLTDCKRIVEQAPTILGRCECRADAKLAADRINAVGGHAYNE